EGAYVVQYAGRRLAGGAHLVEVGGVGDDTHGSDSQIAEDARIIGFPKFWGTCCRAAGAFALSLAFEIACRIPRVLRSAFFQAYDVVQMRRKTKPSEISMSVTMREMLEAG